MNRASLIPTMVLAATLAACGGGGGDADAPGGSGLGLTGGGLAIDQPMLTNIAQNVAIPTYKDLVDKVTALQQAVKAFEAAPTPATLAAARAAWIAARVPWERSEGLQFGPQRTLGIEHRIDSFPVATVDLQAALASSTPIDAALLAQLPTSAKGFHAVELLLYGADGKKLPGDFKPRELAYLDAALADMAAIVTELENAWTTGDNGQPAYAATLSGAGQSDNRVYPSLTAAGQDVIEALGVILAEVKDVQLAAPFNAQNPDLVESQYSGNSLTDFVDNLRGIESVYLGTIGSAPAPAGTSLAEHVAAVKPDVDHAMRTQLTAAITAVQAIPGPYTAAVTSPASAPAINQAIAAVKTLTDTINNSVQPLVTP